MKPTRTLLVASVQMESLPANKDANFEKMERFAAQAASAGARLVVFPECCVSGYWFIRNLTPDELGSLGEPIPGGPSLARLIELAKRHRIAIGAGWIESANDGAFYNSYVVALPDGTFHRNRKIRAFEHPLVRSGSEITVFDLPCGFRAGLLIWGKRVRQRKRKNRRDSNPAWANHRAHILKPHPAFFPRR